MENLLARPHAMASAEVAASPFRLGEWLVMQGWLNPLQLDQALALQARTRSRLGTILTHCFDLAPHKLAQALASQQGIPSLTEHDLARMGDLLSPQHLDAYLRHQLLPISLNEQTGILRVAAVEASLAGEGWLRRTWPRMVRVEWHLCSWRDLRRVINQHLGNAASAHAANRLWRIDPRLSAKQTLLAAQKYRGLFWAASGSVLLWSLPNQMLWGFWGLLELVILAGLLFRLWLVVRGINHHPVLTRLPGWRQKAWRAIPQEDLPIYSVLVPLYQETRMIPHLLARLEALDYPRDKLDIKILIEEDDDATWQAVKAARPEGCVDIIAVPPGEPRTKPKACNYALPYLRGSLVTIYDAEDAPERDQLRMSAWAFAQLPAEVACLQASLNFYNMQQSLLTQWFTLEYALWFGPLLRGLERGQFPIPLGGTSNHIRRFALEQVGGWDAYNVTEDADLGMRLQRYGLRTLLLPSITWEEATAFFDPWLKQRTRWIKGYMQTWCVHMRTPWAEVKALGWRSALGFHLFIGAPCLIHLNVPLLLAVTAITFCWPHLAPFWADELGFATLLLGMALHGVVGFLLLARLPSPPKQHFPAKRLFFAAFIFPLYWFLHSLAALRAGWQLVRKPHHWDKSPHGHSLGQPMQRLRPAKSAPKPHRKGLTASRPAFIEANLT